MDEKMVHFSRSMETIKYTKVKAREMINNILKRRSLDGLNRRINTNKEGIVN